jgi:N-acetylglucosaminyldiphosphoundecaprenol N-acetyl-beta-D-mannosaminyltransferase
LASQSFGKSTYFNKVHHLKDMRNVEYIDRIPVDLNTHDQIFELVNGWLYQRQCSRHIITLNAMMLMAAIKNDCFGEIIKQADLVTVDGYGIDWWLRKKGYCNFQRLTGVNLTRELLIKSCQNGYSVYFLGGTSKVVSMLRKILAEQWPRLNICGIQDGFSISKSRTAILQEIVACKPHLLLVGLGSPQQEMFLAKILPYLDATVGIGVGGTFEVLSGIKREAPQFIRDHGWEWCFRMLQDPRRLKLIPDLVRFWYRYLR